MINGQDGLFILAQNDAEMPEIELPNLPDVPVPPIPGTPGTSPASAEDLESTVPPTPSLPEMPEPGITPVEDTISDMPEMPEIPTIDTDDVDTTAPKTPEMDSMDDTPSPPNLDDIPPPIQPDTTEIDVTEETDSNVEPEEDSTETLDSINLPPPPTPNDEQTETTIDETPDPTDEGKAKSVDISKCYNLPNKLAACESFSCEIPGFDNDNPNFVKTWNVIREENGACVYSESLPADTTLQCRLQERSKNAFSTYLDAVLIKRSPITDQAVMDVYLSARKNECQIFNAAGQAVDAKTFTTISKLPTEVEDYGASDAPRGDCDTLDEKLKTCEPFYCKGNDPIQEKFFDRKIQIERKIIGWVKDSCIYVQKTADKNLEGCKYTKTNGTAASECAPSILTEIAKTGTLFNKLTIAEKAAMADPTLNKPIAKMEETFDEKKEEAIARSELNYKTQLLPNIIHKKQYDEQNKNLPPAYYPSEFKIMVFTALDRGDLTGLRTFLHKVIEIDAQQKRLKKPQLGGLEIRDDRGNTPLIRSVMRGNFEAARMLVGEGADINAQNRSGVTALQTAAYIGREDIVTLLLGMDADRDITDVYGRTAMTHAIEKRFSNITALLLSRNANPNANSGTTVPPLASAARLGDVSAVTSLLNSKADINARDSKNKTVLMYAAENGQTAVVALLLKRGADVTARDKLGRTAEMLASTAGHTQIAGMLATAALNKRLKR